jgi:hypothetical protein
MRKFSFVLIVMGLSIRLSTTANNIHINASLCQDSSLHERFVNSLLNNFEQGGQWLFVQIDSCNIKQDSEVINTMTLYKYYEERSVHAFKEDFATIYAEGIAKHPVFNNCPSFDMEYFGHIAVYPIKGSKVRMIRYGKLVRQGIPKILSTYFDNNKKLKAEYKDLLYELIAVCYIKNIKIVTYANGDAMYEIFK